MQAGVNSTVYTFDIHTYYSYTNDILFTKISHEHLINKSFIKSIATHDFKWLKMYIYICFILRPNLYKSSHLNSLFIPNNSDLIG